MRRARREFDQNPRSIARTFCVRTAWSDHKTQQLLGAFVSKPLSAVSGGPDRWRSSRQRPVLVAEIGIRMQSAVGLIPSHLR